MNNFGSWKWYNWWIYSIIELFDKHLIGIMTLNWSIFYNRSCCLLKWTHSSMVNSCTESWTLRMSESFYGWDPWNCNWIQEYVTICIRPLRLLCRIDCLWALQCEQTRFSFSRTSWELYSLFLNVSLTPNVNSAADKSNTPCAFRHTVNPRQLDRCSLQWRF